MDPKKVDTLAIAWVMSAAAAHPPFRIQFDKYAPHEVPDRKIKPLPIKSFGF
ncbi:MAG: hypothetical protein IIA67_13590 [Planctomycetes bacterium]|nr:hypothetical protein [Planctomycetota bacterium]